MNEWILGVIYGIKKNCKKYKFMHHALSLYITISLLLSLKS